MVLPFLHRNASNAAGAISGVKRRTVGQRKACRGGGIFARFAGSVCRIHHRSLPRAASATTRDQKAPASPTTTASQGKIFMSHLSPS
jgi:hypothetical protein